MREGGRVSNTNTTGAAERLHVSRRRVIKLISLGRLAATQYETGWEIDSDSLDSFRRHARGRPRKNYLDE
jgi:hypothetical protein